MTSFKTVIHPHKKTASGLYSVKIRVLHKRTPKYLPTGFIACENEITSNFSFKRGTSFEDDTLPIVQRYKRICKDHAQMVEKMNVQELAEFLIHYEEKEKQEQEGKISSEDTLIPNENKEMQASAKQEGFRLDIFEFGEIFVSKLDNQNNAAVYVTALNALRRFIMYEQKNRKKKGYDAVGEFRDGVVRLDINQITSKVVQRFIDFLKSEPPRKGRTKGKRAPSLYCSQLQALHKAARQEYNDKDLGIKNIALTPFEDTKKPPIPITDKEPLSLEQMRALLVVPNDTWTRNGDVNLRNFSRDVAILSFLLAGMNTCDLYNCTQIKGDIITYNRKKTKSRRLDGALMRINITPPARALVERYRDKSGKRVFDFYKRYKDADIFGGQVNKGLKRVGKIIGFDDLETYTLRRTWATIAWNYCGVNEDIVDYCLAHSSPKISALYIAKKWEMIYSANQKVIDFVFSNQTGIRVGLNTVDSNIDPKVLVELLKRNPSLAKEVLTTMQQQP